MTCNLTRRDALKIGGMAALAAMFHGFSSGKDMPLAEAKDAFDHILVGSPDLDRAIEWFETKTGVRPAVGGRHPGRGTRNALVSLGKSHYLELLAPDPEQPNVDTPRLRAFRSLSTPAPYTWAARTHDMEATRAAAQQAGFKFEGPTPGSRKRPDGRTLEWSSLALADDLDGLLPFFIQWGPNTLHPSEDSPQGCTLRSLQLIAPDPERLGRALRALNIKADIKKGQQARLAVTLSTRRGEVQL